MVGGVSGKTFVEVAFVSADAVEVLSETGTVDVDASRTEEDAPPDELLLVDRLTPLPRQRPWASAGFGWWDIHQVEPQASNQRS